MVDLRALSSKIGRAIATF